MPGLDETWKSAIDIISLSSNCLGIFFCEYMSYYTSLPLLTGHVKRQIKYCRRLPMDTIPRMEKAHQAGGRVTSRVE
jgi:hypothetical protein